MIQCFMVIEQSGTADPRVLAHGIYTKLVTTFAGLFIAVTVSIAHEYIRKECNKILHHLDLYLLEVRDWVKGQKPQVSYEEREMAHV
jgi:biopolymer transport protein ExbB/TolQ